jgi:hypothetical protein
MEFDKPVTCTYRVALSFTGLMEKSIWYGMEDEDDLFLMDGDWNNHYVAVDAARTIELTAKVIFDSDTEEASVEELVTVIRVRRPPITDSDVEA